MNEKEQMDSGLRRNDECATKAQRSQEKAQEQAPNKMCGKAQNKMRGKAQNKGKKMATANYANGREGG